MSSTLPSESSASRPGGWAARLELRFEQRGEATRLVSNRHFGPLRLLRALPRPDGGCQAVLLHPLLTQRGELRRRARIPRESAYDGYAWLCAWSIQRPRTWSLILFHFRSEDQEHAKLLVAELRVKQCAGVAG